MGPGASADIQRSISSALNPVAPVSPDEDLAKVSAELDSDLAENTTAGRLSAFALLLRRVPCFELGDDVGERDVPAL